MLGSEERDTSNKQKRNSGKEVDLVASGATTREDETQDSQATDIIMSDAEPSQEFPDIAD